MLLENGFVKVWRSFVKWEWYSDINTARLFLHLLLTVNYEPNKWQGKAIERGQRVTSISKLSQETGLSTQSVRTSLKRLKSTCEITIEPTKNYSLITVENYDVYQSRDNDTNKQSNTQANKQLTNSQQTANKQLTTKKESIKKDKERKKKDKEEKNIPPYPLEEFCFNSNMENKILEWLAYKKEKKDEYAPTGFKTLLGQIKRNSEQYGDNAVMELIDESMGSNWKGIIWDRIAKKKQGGNNASIGKNTGSETGERETGGTVYDYERMFD